ncbi:hypothetical protein OE88DRAFT_381921 [Heliocybe sulcata]|uniref:Uncharacterized protein n=1 Tax=Heliocybe sulcata TaxID=5364 RepID=A0A5C3MXW2_9AGAM|nr:hypothetical protein OE88DRAFT_381921 [Heliocybe sulcata]
MKFTTTIAALAVLVPVVLGQAQTTQQSVTYNSAYDNSCLSLASVTCGPTLMSMGFSTFGSLPSFPYIGATSFIPATSTCSQGNCASCYNITNGDVTISILAIHSASAGMSVGLEAMNELTHGQGAQMGALQTGGMQMNVVQVDQSYCGLPSQAANTGTASSQGTNTCAGSCQASNACAGTCQGSNGGASACQGANSCAGSSQASNAFAGACQISNACAGSGLASGGSLIPSTASIAAAPAAGTIAPAAGPSASAAESSAPAPAAESGGSAAGNPVLRFRF